MSNQNTANDAKLFDANGVSYEHPIQKGQILRFNPLTELGFVQVKRHNDMPPINYCFSFAQVFHKNERTKLRTEQEVLFQIDGQGRIVTLKPI